MSKNKHVLVTTQTSIYAGYTEDIDRRPIRLTECRHGFSYTPGPDDQKGIWSLATIGPQEGSKIGPAVPQMDIDHVYNVAITTTAAEQAWLATGWGR